MGASGTNSTQAFYTRLVDAVLGTKMKAINGYKGLNDTFLAMERGEIDGSPSVFYSAITSTRPHWLPDHLAMAILQYGRNFAHAAYQTTTAISASGLNGPRVRQREHGE